MKTHIALAAVLALTLTGCGSAPKPATVINVTTGQQLMDLKAALDEGVISQDEYDRKRKEILHRS